MTIFITGELRIRKIVTCAICSRKDLGLAVRHEIENINLRDLEFNLDKTPNSCDMRVGWAHYGNGIFKCPDCSDIPLKEKI